MTFFFNPQFFLSMRFPSLLFLCLCYVNMFKDLVPPQGSIFFYYKLNGHGGMGFQKQATLTCSRYSQTEKEGLVLPRLLLSAFGHLYATSHTVLPLTTRNDGNRMQTCPLPGNTCPEVFIFAICSLIQSIRRQNCEFLLLDRSRKLFYYKLLFVLLVVCLLFFFASCLTLPHLPSIQNLKPQFIRGLNSRLLLH